MASDSGAGNAFWVDRLADEVVSAFPNASLYRTENGIGASGLPHIGSVSDAVRSYCVSLALTSRGLRAEHIAYSDDKDGLRKVPKGMPESLARYIGVPVTSVPDPEGCHSSYGQHMGGLLLSALDRLGIKYTPISATEMYRSGALNPQIHLILTQWKKVGQIIYEETGQEKYLHTLPYMAVCGGCGRIYTTTVRNYDPKTQTVSYECSGGEIGGKASPGCGFSGERSLSQGEGKLAWKTEFAARWAALGISFEAYGKELTSSIRTNDRICQEILGVKPPVHTRYELFITKEGKKMSKSSGDLITAETWLRYGSPQSLLLLMLKRFEGTRAIGVEDIPVYMGELDRLEDLYFGKATVTDEAERRDKILLFRYVNLLNPPQKPSLHPPYNLLTYLATTAPKHDPVNFILSKLKAYGYASNDPDQEKDLLARIEFALNWVRDRNEVAATATLSSEDRELVFEVLKKLEAKNDEQGYQSAVYEAAKDIGTEPKRVFLAVYRALLGADSGPRLGAYISAMGKSNVLNRLREAVGA
ncbi:MAG: lysine--tRNA ligase [Thermoprotei archaeon]